MKRTLRLAIILTLCTLSSIVQAQGKNPSQGAAIPDSSMMPIHEPIEWTDIWVTNADKDDLPRVLFVGDSIVKGYFRAAEKGLDGKANCARLATSAFISHEDFIGNLETLLKRYSWDVIHINNGLHGWDYTEQQYRDGFPALAALLKTHAKDATIVWALTTPLRERDNLARIRMESTARVRNRNEIAAAFAKKQGWRISDLFSLSIDHADHHRGDGTHFSPKGIAAQGEFVAAVTGKALADRARRNKDRNAAASAREYHVSPKGDDANPGTREKPFASPHHARDQVRKYKKAHPAGDVTVWFGGGTYPLTETLVFTLEDSGSKTQTITYAALPGETPVLSAAVPVGGWKLLKNPPEDLPQAAHGKVWVADTSFLRKIKANQSPSPTVATQMDRVGRVLTLYGTGRALPRASGPWFSVHKVPEGSEPADRTFGFPEAVLQNWADLSEAEFTVIPARRWISNTLPLESVDEVQHIARTAATPTYSLQPHGTVSKGKDARIENSLALLDEPGEWMHDSRTDTLYLWPPNGGEPSHITAPVLTELIRVEGKTDYAGPIDTPVRGLVFRGLTLMQGERFRWQGRTGWGVQHDWERFDSPSAMMRLRGAEDCAIEDCTFTTAGASGLRLDLHCQKIRVIGNRLCDLGGVGIFLGGYGPGTKDVNRDNRVENNLVHHIGQIYHGSPGIFVWQSGHNRVANNELHDLPYAGICVTGRIVWGDSGREECAQTIRWDEVKANRDTWEFSGRAASWAEREKFLHSRINLVLRNDIHAVMQRCGDGNCIYISGAGGGNRVVENYCHDSQSMTMNSTIRCDDDQNDTLITRNIIFRNAGDGEGFLSKGKNDFVENLIIDMQSNNDRHRGYLRFYGGIVEGSVYEHNIFYSRRAGQTVLLENPALKDTPGTKLRDSKADYNLFWCTEDPQWGADYLAEQQDFGIETHSIAVDPMFEDIDGGDFRFKPDSPALGLGIKQPISVREVGPREPHRAKFKGMRKPASLGKVDVRPDAK
ncbi:MAG: right-handed parallel beta-helix repeat-containing protein [Pontiella sp.]